MLKFILAQLNFTVGDIDGNAQKIIDAAKQARNHYQSDIIIFPELALCGYPPEDLLFRRDFPEKIKKALKHIQENLPAEICAVIGYPEYAENNIYNSAIILTSEKILMNYRKVLLPNYGVFDEKRYFTPGKNINNSNTGVFIYKNCSLGIAICEDMWFAGVARERREAGAQILLTLNASPFHSGKLQQRLAKMQECVQESGLALLYVNHCGGQDDLIFDGSSFALNAQGQMISCGPFGEEIVLEIKININKNNINLEDFNDKKSDISQIYQALVLGVRDYVRKNHFQKVLLGFSGGIDSALVLAISADALGKENVLPVMMPSQHTSALSLNAASEQLERMGLNSVNTQKIIPIQKIYTQFLSQLELLDSDKNTYTSITAQNLQARIRAVILMAISNETGALLLNTSNKSELAVGYGTLYGDMCGAYGVIKDVWKTQVYELAHYRNQLSPVIPEEILHRPPSAELAPHQADTDTLPPYEILDEILKKYIEQNLSGEDIILQTGCQVGLVHQVIQLIVRNEYKRKQAPLGPRVSPLAFSRERRYPVTSSFDAR